MIPRGHESEGKSKEVGAGTLLRFGSALGTGSGFLGLGLSVAR